MTVPIRSFRVRYAVSILGLSTLVLAIGCGDGSKTAKVSGKVTLNGESLKGGTVTFEGSKGGVSGVIDHEGTYTIPNAPVGEVKISLASGVDMTPQPQSPLPDDVKPGSPPKRPKSRMRAPLRPAQNIPPKYTKPETSGLTYTVKPGEQTFDIPLSSP